MKIITLAISAFYLAAGPVSAGMIINPYRFTTPGGGGGFLLEEGFEGTGYQNTWTASGTGTVDPDEATTVITGSQSLRINLATQTGSTYSDFTAQGSIFTKFRLRVASTNGGTQPIATIRNSTTVLATLSLAGASRVMRANAAGGSNNTSIDALPVDTNLYVWFEYVKGTGSNAICRVAWSTTDSKPTIVATGGKTAESTNGTGTADGARFYFGNTSSGVTEFYADSLQISATTF